MAATRRAPRLRRGLAFLAGVGFAAVPTVGPYLAILGTATGRFEVQRADRWWWAAAVLLGLPWLIAGHVWPGLGAIAQALAVWLIFRSAATLRASVDPTTFPRDVGAGLLLGLAGAIALGLERAGTWRPETARSVFDLIAWTGSPALFGHAMLVLAALLAVVLPSPRARVVALALGALAVLVAGAQEAVLAWLVIAVGLRFVGRRGGRSIAIAEWALIVLMAVVAVGATTLVGTGRTGFRVDLAADAASANLFRGVEAADGAWWYPLGVRFEAASGSVAGEPRTVYSVTKVDDAGWSRLQQVVLLEPGGTYTLSVAWRADPGVRPGLDGWGRDGVTGASVNLAATAVDGAWRTAGSPEIVVLDHGSAATDDGWTRAYVAFRYVGEVPLAWYVGMVPDRGTAVGATTAFAELQLVAGATARPYVPVPAEFGLTDLRVTRFPIWATATDASAARPWLGWGPGGYPAALAALDPAGSRQRPPVAHAHDTFLDVTVERGLLGLTGLLMLVGALALRAVQQRDRAMGVVLTGIALLAVFDATLLNAAIIYPLAAVLGWRAVGGRRIARTETGFGSAVAVRLTLAAVDVAVATLAVSVAALATHPGTAAEALAGTWTPALAYATLLWPAFAAANGLYPGYGRALHDELARGVRAATAAAVALGALALVVPAAIPLDGTGVLIVAVVGVLAVPLARLSTKLALRTARLWGRPVAILGTGATAARVARHLLDHPAIGLRPVAAFGDADWDVPGLAVSGRASDLWRALPALGVRHVIVAADAAAHGHYDEVLRHAERAVRYVQFVPDLPGVPASSVVATPIGTTLGLEVRNQLASRTNRALKRAIDLAAASLLLLLLGPALLVVAAWVRVDSRGPVLYRAPRVGRYGRVFTCLKFRTMRVDAEARLQELLASDPALAAEYAKYHKLTDDPRVTRAGRWLRRFSIDEFAQLLNVVRGEMSLVGPRPYLVRELDRMGDERDLIFLARPGMTGHWQVEGRNDVSFEERQTMEAAYVRNWSAWWDLELLLRTPIAVLSRRGR